jgi:hypothetical protein
VNTTLGTLIVGGQSGDIVLSAGGTGSTGNFGAISGSGLDITGNANIAGNLTLGGTITIGDNSSDNVVVNADLSSSIIPNNDNSFDLGSTSFRYRAIHGTNIHGAINATNGVVSGSSQVIGILDSLNTFSGSQLTQNSNLATITGSLISTASLNVGRLTAIEAVSGTFARTNSTNIFNGNQTVSGSLYVTQDLVVGGSSSIQNISSSNLVIGTAFVTLNTSTPSSRFAGLQIIDSGSSGGSGSFLYDAVQDEFIFIHRGNGTNITSSHFLLGPETYDNLGNESYLTNNRVSKGTGKEHLVDSNITDDGSLITLGSNTTITGTLVASGTTLVSGSSQINATATTNWSTGIKTRLDAETVVSGSKTISGITLGSNLATLTIGTGLSGTSYNGSTGVTIANTGVTSITAGTGVSRDSATGTVTISIGQAVATSDNVRFASIGVGMAASGTSGRIDAANDIVAFSTSDVRLKENIKPIENALDKISKISGNTYDWRAEFKDVHGYEGNDVGVIAQEVEAVLPQLVQDRDNGYKAVKYDKLVALLIEGIKEQQTQIHNLTLEIENLKKNNSL